MSRVSKPALRGTALGALLGMLNPFMRAILGSPMHWPLSRWFALVRWTGPRTGRTYTIPVSYVREGATAYLTSGDRWTRNLATGRPVAVRLRGRWRESRAQVVTDPAQSMAGHARLFREHPWFRVLAGIPAGEGRGADPAALERAMAAGRVLVRVDLAEAHR